MRLFEIWIEGYRVTGDSNTAQFLGSFLADTFDEAVKKYRDLNGSNVEFDRFGKGRHAIWACELFDNEVAARKSFG